MGLWGVPETVTFVVCRGPIQPVGRAVIRTGDERGKMEKGACDWFSHFLNTDLMSPGAAAPGGMVPDCTFCE